MGSVVGGFSAGFLWTALGNFLQASASLYSTATTLSISKSNSLLSGIFSFTYLFGEALVKCASTWIPDAFDGGETTVYIVFTIISLVCALLTLYVEDVQDLVRRQENASRENNATSSFSIMSKIFSAIKLLTSDIKMILLYPNNMAFGFSSAFVSYYANGTLVKSCVNTDDMNYIGYFAALVALIAGVSCPIFSLITRNVFRGNKMFVMILGIVAISVEMLVYMLYDLNREDLVRGEKICNARDLVVLYLLHGIGRGVWESTNKAVVLDFFPNSVTAAFANILVANGLASTVGFFIYEAEPKLKDDPFAMTTLTFSLCLISLIAFPLASYLNNHHRVMIDDNNIGVSSSGVAFKIVSNSLENDCGSDDSLSVSFLPREEEHGDL